MALEPTPDGAPREQELLGGVRRHHEAESLAAPALRDVEDAVRRPAGADGAHAQRVRQPSTARPRPSRGRPPGPSPSRRGGRPSPPRARDRAGTATYRRAGSEATTRAPTASPPMNSTVISSIEWTTCAASSRCLRRRSAPRSRSRRSGQGRTRRRLARGRESLRRRGLTWRKTSPTAWARAGVGGPSVTTQQSSRSAVRRMVMRDPLGGRSRCSGRIFPPAPAFGYPDRGGDVDAGRNESASRAWRSERAWTGNVVPTRSHTTSSHMTRWWQCRRRSRGRPTPSSAAVGSGIIGSGEDAQQLLVRLPALEDDDVARLLLERGGATPSRHHPLAGRRDRTKIRRRYNGIADEVMQRPDLLALLLPGLRADLSIIEAYVHRPGRALDSDRRIRGRQGPRGDRGGGRRMAADNCCPLGSDVPGGDFFVHSAHEELMRTLSEELMLATDRTTGPWS